MPIAFFIWPLQGHSIFLPRQVLSRPRDPGAPWSSSCWRPCFCHPHRTELHAEQLQGKGGCINFNQWKLELESSLVSDRTNRTKRSLPKALASMHPASWWSGPTANCRICKPFSVLPSVVPTLRLQARLMSSDRLPSCFLDRRIWLWINPLVNTKIDGKLMCYLNKKNVQPIFQPSPHTCRRVTIAIAFSWLSDLARPSHKDWLIPMLQPQRSSARAANQFLQLKNLALALSIVSIALSPSFATTRSPWTWHLIGFVAKKMGGT